MIYCSQIFQFVWVLWVYINNIFCREFSRLLHSYVVWNIVFSNNWIHFVKTLRKDELLNSFVFRSNARMKQKQNLYVYKPDYPIFCPFFNDAVFHCLSFIKTGTYNSSLKIIFYAHVASNRFYWYIAITQSYWCSLFNRDWVHDMHKNN